MLLESTPAGKSPEPLLVTENYGRGRTVLFATGGSWRWKMWKPHDDKTHATFWQQLLRYLVTDTPGQVIVHHAEVRALGRDARAHSRRGPGQGIQAGDQRQGAGAVHGAGRRHRHHGIELRCRSKKASTAATGPPRSPATTWPRSSPGGSRKRSGRDVLTFRREDGVAENFHTSQNRELLEKLSEQTGGRYYKPRSKRPSLSSEISYSEAGITTRETKDLWDMPIVFLLALAFRASEWLLRQALGGGMSSRGWGLGAGGWGVLAASLLVSASSVSATTYYVTISGLGGEPDYVQRFKGWADDIDASLKKAGGDATVVTMEAPTREQIRTRLTELSQKVKPTDALVVMLIGHGSYDGVDYKFNIPGPDITGAELGSLLDHIPATRQLVVNATSSSGGSIAALRRPNRIVISATKSGTEKNATVFARYWAEALRDPAADADKNEAISALEAFKFAQRKTAEAYDTQKRLATEHAVLEDTGKGEGEKSPSTDNGEGKLAAMFPVVRLGANAAAARDPEKRPLLDRKEQLEQAIDKLKYEKVAMAADDYKKQLTALLLELAKVQEALDK